MVNKVHVKQCKIHAKTQNSYYHKLKILSLQTDISGQTVLTLRSDQGLHFCYCICIFEGITA